jgi:hypothetical protein
MEHIRYTPQRPTADCPVLQRPAGRENVSPWWKLPLITQPLLPCLLPPNPILPCTESSTRTTDNDVRLVILFVSDPKFQGEASLLG